VTTRLAPRAPVGNSIGMLALALLACDDAILGVPVESTTPAPASSPTWHRDIRPIVETHCTGCHKDGGIGPFALGTFATDAAMAGAIAAAAAGGAMPPWPPADGCNAYVGERRLTSAEIATLAAWRDADAPEGSTDEGVAGTPAADGLTRVDLSLSLPEAYTPVTSPDDYRCFLLDVSAPGDGFLTGFGVAPDQSAIVHHAIAYLAKAEDIATYEALDAEDATPGWECFGGPGGDSAPDWLGAWVPGSVGNDYPAGTGIPVAYGSRVVVQMHYNMDYAPPTPDQTEVLLRYEPSVETPAAMLRWTDPAWPPGGMPIPAGEPDVVFNYRAPNPLATAGLVWAAGLHMHLIGTSAKLAVHHADGTETCLLDIPRWDFHWQGIYFLQEPVAVGPTDEIEIECHFDASQATADLNWGEGSADEMCLGVVYATAGGG
jgi:hypothetical protein